VRVIEYCINLSKKIKQNQNYLLKKRRFGQTLGMVGKPSMSGVLWR
jgi:hypothetical protein